MGKESPTIFSINKSYCVPAGRVVFTCTILGFLAACAPISPTAKQDRELFERLCSASDRNWLTREVFVEGYAHAQAFEENNSCLDTRDSILFNGFEYHECVQGAWNDKDNKNIMTYKLSLKPKGHINCSEERYELLRKSKIEILDNWLMGLQTRENKFLGLCISIEQYHYPVSRYVKLIDSGHVSANGAHLPNRPPNSSKIPGYISYVRTRILDRQSDSYIFENRYYWYFPMSPMFSGSRNGTQTCITETEIRADDMLNPIQ